MMKAAQINQHMLNKRNNTLLQHLVKHFLRALDNVMTYVWINMTAVVSLMFFKVLNRTEVIGQENIPHDRDVLLCSNHQTMIDSFLIGTFAFFPKVLYRPELLPYHPAALENFFKGPILSWMSKKWRCIPVKRGVRDMKALSEMIQSLKNGTMVIFPEGTRSRTGRVGQGRVGVGKLIYDSNAVVVPVAIHGMNKVLPIGAKYPRFFNKIRIIYGEPMDLSEYLALPEGKETSRKIVDAVIGEITDLYNFLGLRAYLETAKRISNPKLREQELTTLAEMHGIEEQLLFNKPEYSAGKKHFSLPVQIFSPSEEKSQKMTAEENIH